MNENTETTIEWLCMNPWEWKEAEMELNGKEVILNNMFKETQIFNRYIVAPRAKDPEMWLTEEDIKWLEPNSKVKITKFRTEEKGENNE